MKLVKINLFALSFRIKNRSYLITYELTIFNISHELFLVGGII